MTIKKFQNSILYFSKIERIISKNYPPLPCYAALHLHNKEVLNTYCDCKKSCKFEPTSSSGNCENYSYYSKDKLLLNHM